MNTKEQLKEKLNFDFEPAFTEEQVFKLEGKYDTTWGVCRRLMMITLSRSGQDLVDSLTSMLAEDETGDAYFEMIKHIDEYKQHLESGIELAQAATARLLLVAQHVADDEVEPTELA